MPIVKRIIANDTVYELMGSGGEGSSDNKIVFTAIANTSSSTKLAISPGSSSLPITNVTLVKGNIQVLYEEIKAKEPISGELSITRETVNEYAPEIYYYNSPLLSAFYTIDGNEIIELDFKIYLLSSVTICIILSSNDGFNTYTITTSTEPYTPSYDSGGSSIE